MFAGAIQDPSSEALVAETRERIIDTMLVNHFGSSSRQHTTLRSALTAHVKVLPALTDSTSPNPVRSLRDRRQFLGAQFGGGHDVAGTLLVDTWQVWAHAARR